MHLVLFVVAACADLLPAPSGGRGDLKSRFMERMQILYREAKAMASSDFEAALLKSTRPDTAPAKIKHVASIVASIEDFDAFVSADCDPYGLLLHKIWSRLVETSPLTTTKAIYVYRMCLLPHLGLARARLLLGKQRSSRSATFYFASEAVTDIEDRGLQSGAWRHFIARYWFYVDAAWLACAEPQLLVTDDPPITRLAALAARLLVKNARVLFDARKARWRALPDCPLIVSCVHQILDDALALQLMLFLCFLVDPAQAANAVAPDDRPAIALYLRRASPLHHPNAPSPAVARLLRRPQSST